MLRQVSLQSRERLETTFSPSLLLSLGDILSFLSDAGSISPSGEPISLQHWYGRSTDQAPQPAPTIEEQMALQRPLTSRIPQKYLIRNFTGLALRYWSGDSERVTSYSLPHLGEETLAIEPSSSTMSVLMGKERNLMRYPARVVHLRFEGNWMPVRNIAVNHISTTCYRVVSPLEGVSVPLIVDISLDGRTKTVVLRSAVTLRNCCDQLLSFRLHIPNLNVVGPSWIGESIRTPSTPAHEEQPISSSRNDIDLGWFADGEAFHLPIYAVLGGTLYMKSKDVHEAAGDAVHLMPSIQDMRAQQVRDKRPLFSFFHCFHSKPRVSPPLLSSRLPCWPWRIAGVRALPLPQPEPNLQLRGAGQAAVAHAAEQRQDVGDHRAVDCAHRLRDPVQANSAAVQRPAIPPHHDHQGAVPGAIPPVSPPSSGAPGLVLFTGNILVDRPRVRHRANYG